MLDQKSYVFYIKKLQELEKVEKELNHSFEKLSFDSVAISFDSYRDLVLNIIETSMGDENRYTSNFIYNTNYGSDVNEKELRDFGLNSVKNLEDLYDFIISKKLNRRVFVISDTHFNHQNIIKYCNRPYNSVREMNWDIIRKWNSVVGPNDIVFHLGDFGFGTQMELNHLLNQLNGKKYLILGNHDNKFGKKFYEQIGFSEVFNKKFVVGNIVLSHYPKQINENQINIYGHIHNSEPQDWYNDDKHYCVSVEKINYTPIEISELIGGFYE